MKWFDASWPLTNDIASYPGNVKIHLEDLQTVKEHGSRVSTLKLGSHTGTHYDAPNHFIQGAAGVDAIPLDATVGPARVLDLTHLDRHVRPQDLDSVRQGERILLKTRNSQLPDERFDQDFLALTEEAARLLVDRKVRTIGIDYLSIEPYRQPKPLVHLALLGGGVTVLEGLRLRHVEHGEYILHAPPLLYVGGDGAPARALLEKPG